MDENQRAASKRKVKRNPKTPKSLIKKVQKAMENTENIDKNEVQSDLSHLVLPPETEDNLRMAKQLLGLPDDFVYDENLVFVDARELNNLVQQNHDLKSEVGKLVGLFQHFTGLFSGANIMAIAMKIPALIKDESIKAQVELVLPIIDKYKPKA